ncbi:MAG: hypothetical protein ACKERG_03315 [Candidatus Hodgkinia cicadicola]
MARWIWVISRPASRPFSEGLAERSGRGKVRCKLGGPAGRSGGLVRRMLVRWAHGEGEEGCVGGVSSV